MYRRFLSGCLEFSERHSMDRVHDRRHLLVPGGGPAEDARLRAVRVHDLGLEPSKGRPQPAVGLQVNDRPDRPDQLGKDLDLQAQLLRPVEQIAFGPFGRAR